MDSHVWQSVDQTIREVDRAIPRLARTPVYSDVLIVAMYIWSVAHDRPLCWACDRSHYGSVFRPRRLPSVSRFCRRIKTPRCEKILQQVYDHLAANRESATVSFLDGRPLPVGPCSKDQDARPGRVYGGFARGYKLHALVSKDKRVLAWSATSLNRAEIKVAEVLVDKARSCGLVFADNNYDSRKLYDAVASYGGHLLTPLPKNAGCGHIRQSPARLAAVEAWKGIAGYVYKDRVIVERCFSHISSFGGGLAPLPPWVRTLPRVRRWVGTKLILYHARKAFWRVVS